jgi:tetratricopeptide (TPR) repeat protein
MGTKSLDSGFLQESEVLYNRCLDLDTDHSDCHRGLAVLLTQTNRKQEAFDLLVNWGKDRPHLADPEVELARLYQEAGDVQATRKHLEQACSIDRNHPRAWKALAALNDSQGNTELALAQYQRSYILDNHQTELATRITSLNQQLRNSSTESANTRMANENVSRGRY